MSFKAKVIEKVKSGFHPYLEPADQEYWLPIVEVLLDLVEQKNEALGFYADKRNWGETTKDMREWYLIESTDRGDKACKTLSLDQAFLEKLEGR